MHDDCHQDDFIIILCCASSSSSTLIGGIGLSVSSLALLASLVLLLLCLPGTSVVVVACQDVIIRMIS
jgi:hypothetical protein